MILEMEVLSIIRYIIIRFLEFKFEASQIHLSKIIRFGNRKAEYLFIPRQKVNIYTLPSLIIYLFHPRSPFTIVHPGPLCPDPHQILLGIIEENDIFENAMAGIWVKLNSDPIVRNNKIHSGQDCGICIFSKSKGLYQK